MSSAVLFDLWRAGRRAGTLLEDRLEGSDLSPTEFGLYSLLLSYEEPVPVSRVARNSGVPLPTASQQLARIEERGHLTRSTDPDDGRVSLLALNPAGRNAHQKAAAPFREALHELEKELGSDHDQVAYSLRRIEAALASLMDAPHHPMPPRPTTATAHTVHYSGTPLTRTQEGEVRSYVDWLRTRDR